MVNTAYPYAVFEKKLFILPVVLLYMIKKKKSEGKDCSWDPS